MNVEKMKRYVVILGPPFSGKTSVAYMLAPAMQLGHLHMEHLARVKNLQLATMSDDEIVQLVAEEIDSPNFTEGAIFDGFPQNVEQAILLDALLWGRGHRITDVINFEFGENSVMYKIVFPQRAAGRRVCTSCGRVYGKTWTTTPTRENSCDDCGITLVGAIHDRLYPAVRRRLETTAVIIEALVEHYRPRYFYRATKPDMSEFNSAYIVTRLGFRSDDLPVDGAAAIRRILPEAYYPLRFEVRDVLMPEVGPLLRIDP